jgi:hypothetical protein
MPDPIRYEDDKSGSIDLSADTADIGVIDLSSASAGEFLRQQQAAYLLLQGAQLPSSFCDLSLQEVNAAILCARNYFLSLESRPPSAGSRSVAPSVSIVARTASTGSMSSDAVESVGELNQAHSRLKPM